MFNGWVAGALFYDPISISLFFSNISLFLAVYQRTIKEN
jgi:hypothetical protein